ncbi:MoaD/ThiS family protein [Alphaproteobacteria bacterium]|jgi:molybdopterin converting factor small subunit|nr:MoaD/ThiS family protein [Alphaproteobacteria bacterium]
MARIILTDSLSKRFTDGNSDFDIVAPSVRSLIRELDNRYPGLGTQISDGTLSVAIDGDIYQDAFLEELKPDSEVAFLPKIGGG